MASYEQKPATGSDRRLDDGRQSQTPLKTAVLFLLFNRPGLSKKVFEAIRQVRPPRLYISVDGPREGVQGERAMVEEVRSIANDVDWDCKVKTRFNKENKGCRIAVSTALDWFFDHESEGIVLEDDCLPSESFFWYCQELLERYRDDERIMVISGNNFQRGWIRSNDSYYFSRYNHCWGWASWRRAWRQYDRDLQGWPEFRERGYLKDLSNGNRAFVYYWTEIFDRCARGEIDSWAYRWTFSCWSQGGLTCLPQRNLVTNIGFGEVSTHTKRGDGYVESLPLQEMELPMRHPAFVVRDSFADLRTDRMHFKINFTLLVKAWMVALLRAIPVINNVLKR